MSVEPLVEKKSHLVVDCEIYSILELDKRAAVRPIPPLDSPKSTSNYLGLQTRKLSRPSTILRHTAILWVATVEKVRPNQWIPTINPLMSTVTPPGGKAKPLKAPKKEKKDVDEDDLAFREKQKAGAFYTIQRDFDHKAMSDGGPLWMA